MRATVQCGELRNIVGKVLNIVSRKNIRPILTQSLISIQNDSVEIFATNLEVSAKIKISGTVEERGIFCVNPRRLFDILRELPDTEIILSLGSKKEEEEQEYSNMLSLHCNDIHFCLRVQTGDDFPQIVFKEKEFHFNIYSNDLLTIIEKTSYALSDDDTQVYLNGIYFQEIDSKIRAVATDGNRLSLMDTNLSRSDIEPLMDGIIISKKGVIELRRIAESFPKRDLHVSMDDSFIHVKVDDLYELSIRLMAHDYPEYQKAIPTKYSFLLKADKEAFVEAVRRIKIMSNDRYKGVRVKLKDSEMVLTSQIPALGAADEKIYVDYTGRDMDICFDASYLMDALSPLESGEVLLELNNEFSPIVFKSKKLPDYLGVVMPLNL